MARCTILQLVAFDDTGDSCYRMRWPAAALARKNPDWTVINLGADAAERYDLALSADLLVLFQSQDPDLIPLMAKRRAAGKRTLAEYNDNFYQPPPASPVAKDWASPLLCQSYESIMHSSDGLLVTGPGLRDVFQPKVRVPVHILRNQLPAVDPFKDRPEGETVAIGWAGSLGHVSDLLAIVPLLRSLVRKDARVRVHIMGNDAFPALLGIPDEKLIYRPWGDMNSYYEFWSQVDIGLVPLIPTPYNLCRSDVKALEIAGSSVLPLLPNLLPYQDFLEKTGLEGYGSLHELEELLEKYLLAPALRMTDTRRAYDYVSTERLEDSSRERDELYASYLPASDKTPQGGPRGFFEVKGTRSNETVLMKRLKEAQAIVTEGRFDFALQLLEDSIRDAPRSAELLLAKCKCLVQMKREISLEVDKARELFPLDLRFLLLQVGARRREASAEDAWETILSTLESESESLRDFYKSDVLKAFARENSGLPFYSQILKRLAVIYPEVLKLSFQAAVLIEEEGDYGRAADIYTYIVQCLRVLKSNGAVNEEPDEVVVRSRLQAALFLSGRKLK